MKPEFQNFEFGFKVCRVCLETETESTILSSLFDGNGEEAVKFQTIMGFDVSKIMNFK